MWNSLVEWARRKRSPPELRLTELGISKGMTVADVGAGFGYFALPAAEAVGEGGAVYAIEPDPRRASQISRRAEEEGLGNVRVLVTGAEDMVGVPTGAVDVAMSMSSFHHFSDQKKALTELKRVVRPGGVIYIRDMKPGRLSKHGSERTRFEKTISEQFPGALFEEDRRFLVARVRN